jgi:hypothetical protein
MYPENYLTFMNRHSETHFHPDPHSESASRENAPSFPHELLNSGFELTEILTTESKPSTRTWRGYEAS